ncbi:MAG TPA: hypothetical protein VGF67_23180 [Ktedonobacteraceae bacterium]|jgi:hypothetical protein
MPETLRHCAERDRCRRAQRAFEPIVVAIRRPGFPTRFLGTLLSLCPFSLSRELRNEQPIARTGLLPTWNVPPSWRGVDERAVSNVHLPSRCAGHGAGPGDAGLQVHQKLWNFGQAPSLIVGLPNVVQVAPVLITQTTMRAQGSSSQWSRLSEAVSLSNREIFARKPLYCGKHLGEEVIQS